MTAVVLVIVLITKFPARAWIAILAMVVISSPWRGILAPLRPGVGGSLVPSDEETVLPARNHVVVPSVEGHKTHAARPWHTAGRTRPDTLTASP